MAAATAQSATDGHDVVANLGLYLSDDKRDFKEMTDIVESARIYGKPVVVKFILEPGYFDVLPTKEAIQTSLSIQQAGGFCKLAWHARGGRRLMM